ncbi:unnamed protein product [Vitrella brassicaformis CCMP3155]|uniref:DUF1754-domain-containing protein n=1 Tax=Vitrella brassicaformis (strain CCMP3155) TaxID=1169540 RepID=A0A0G4H8W1_VITBC|nr:unnamed protein product [Vitrella brassicaformis CCMP3155]|mmetsp:Transcript_39018/g.97666  ORF Transcript_39018/g.97666 Transcript_39018/m.97666 type:complete len:145 (-) Transcript_39018:452-886(-)|eukprot:CEM40139.1 unnamed protein product [Vitrella brassicaformis CCMP3155]
MSDSVYTDGVVRKGLKLKGGELAVKGKKKKKRKAEEISQQQDTDRQHRDQDRDEDQDEQHQDKKHEGEGTTNAAKDVERPPAIDDEEEEDTRTEAEKAFALAQEKRAKDRADKRIELSHRQRIEKFNEQLGQLSEHFDIPKVGG